MEGVSMKKGAAYARYSTNKQTENSIEYQLTQILKYCSENGITIVATYTDEGQSYKEILDKLDGALGKRGRPIGSNSLHSILTNERYIGVYTWNKRRVKILRKWAGGKPNPNCVRIEDAIPPIIDTATFR